MKPTADHHDFNRSHGVRDINGGHRPADLARAACGRRRADPAVGGLHSADLRGGYSGDVMFDVLNSSTSDQTTPAAGDSLEACFFTHKPVSDAAVFGSPLAFHERRYNGFSNAYLIQDVGIYADRRPRRGRTARSPTAST